MVGYAGSTTLYLDMTYEGGTPDRKSFTAGTAVSISSTGMHADLTTIAAASTPGAKTFINYSNTPPTTTAAGSRVGWSIAVAPAATAPTVSATISASDPVVGTALSLNGTITGTATSQGWSQISGPTSPTISGSTTVTGTVTPTVAGTYVFQFDASNTAGAATPAQVTAYVHPASGDPTPVVAVTLGVFTALAGTTAAANLNDANDTTGIQNTGTPVHTDKATITYAPLGLGGITFPLRGRWTSSALTMRGIAYKADGTTQLFTADFTLTNTVATYNLVLDSTALAAIPALSDRRALIVKVSAA
jgi:hypothetical protein